MTKIRTKVVLFLEIGGCSIDLSAWFDLPGYVPAGTDLMLNPDGDMGAYLVAEGKGVGPSLNLKTGEYEVSVFDKTKWADIGEAMAVFEPLGFQPDTGQFVKKVWVSSRG